MLLSRDTAINIENNKVQKPDAALFNLPEKVLQFGTGVLLRGLPDYFIDKANKKGIFNGRIVVIKSTDGGESSAFDQQDNVYTLCVRGIEDGTPVSTNIINASISRVLTAKTEWQQVLQCAHNKELQIIISNTTEVGIQLVNESINQDPPQSFPAKLLRFLYERYTLTKGIKGTGFVIIPTELIVDNGNKLLEILLQLAQYNKLDDAFIQWLKEENSFCNSLVDRIVPGKPEEKIKKELEGELHYKDDLLCICEVYRLWAIQGNEKIKNILSFAPADEGVVITNDITLHRELKLRLLNGTHTLSCGLAYLAGMTTVQQAMEESNVGRFITTLLQQELAPSIPYAIDATTSKAFGSKVLDRFRNPYIQHPWINITVQYTSKMKMRCVPLLLQYYKNNKSVPPAFALGFAAYLYFTKPVAIKDNKYYGEKEGVLYPIADDKAATFYEAWKDTTPEALVQKVLSDVGLWDNDLSVLPGFKQAVVHYLQSISNKGMQATLAALLQNNNVAAV